VFSSAATAGVTAGKPGAAPVVGTSSASLGLARAGAAMGASAGGVVYPDVVVDKSDYETIGMRVDRMKADDSSTVSATAEHQTGIDRAIVASDNRVALAAREASAGRLVTSEQIRAATPQERSHVTGAVAASMSDDAKFMARAKHDEKNWSDEQRADFKVAAKEAAARAKVVKKDMKAAEKASDQDWAQARAQLATDYAAYAQAADHARAVATASANANAQANAAAKAPAAKVTGAAESSTSGQTRL
jgi:hypothetical protein